MHAGLSSGEALGAQCLGMLGLGGGCAAIRQCGVSLGAQALLASELRPAWAVGSRGFRVLVRVPRLWVGLCRARRLPLLPEFQGMLKDVSEGKALEPLAVLPAAGSLVRGWGQDSGRSMGLGAGWPRSALPWEQWVLGLACPNSFRLDGLWCWLQN